jgi:orotidine-5'-phosphate decarboxylase
MNREELIKQIQRKSSMLCVGLDPDPSRIPNEYSKEENPTLSFLIRVVDETADFCVAFKPNLAFFEVDGWLGIKRFEKLVHYIREHHPNHLIIADAKRGDIGNTAKMYAKAFFETIPCDALTISPYMGSDSIEPYKEYEDKWLVVLGLTSNKGASDLELKKLESEERVYEHSMKLTSELVSEEQLMFVVGATRPEVLKSIRAKYPNHFFLVPGVGAQGGSVDEVCNAAVTKFGGLLINASRSILYPENTSSQEPHRLAAWELQRQMAPHISFEGMLA